MWHVYAGFLVGEITDGRNFLHSIDCTAVFGLMFDFQLEIHSAFGARSNIIVLVRLLTRGASSGGSSGCRGVARIRGGVHQGARVAPRQAILVNERWGCGLMQTGMGVEVHVMHMVHRR